MIGFVLAVISMLTTAIMFFGFPLFSAWLDKHGVPGLELFLLGIAFVVFCAIQGLLLFGFPLYYAQDQKSHMTGFRILAYAILWMVVSALLIGCAFVSLKQQNAYTLDQLNPAEETGGALDSTL